jgi:hypothetical protein
MDHSSWYKKHDIAVGFSNDEEGSESSTQQSDDDSDDASVKDTMPLTIIRNLPSDSFNKPEDL